MRVTVRRSAMWGRYRPCHLMGFSRSAYERLQAAGGCAFAGSFLLAWRMITVIRALRPRLACAGSGPLARGGQGCVDRVTVSLVVPAPARVRPSAENATARHRCWTDPWQVTP